MVKLGVIGLGTIFPMQQEALNRLTDEYTIVAVCDKDREKWKNCKNTTGDIRFFKSSAELQAIKEIEDVLIATPPHTHYMLALECMNAGKNVLLEKPAVFSVNELEKLYECASKQGVLLHIAYHSSFAIDIEWYLEHQYGKITSICCGFYDPYIEENKIISGKELLGGSFMDSGVNALSVFARLVDMQQMRLTTHEVQQLNGVVYSSKTKYESPEVEIVMYTGWDQGKNEKTTLLEFEESEDKIMLDHSNQRVVLYRKDGEREELYREDSVVRLVTHYMGVFRDFKKALTSGISNKEVSLEIHRLLFSN